MPEPGDMRPARIEKTTHDLVWEGVFLPLSRLVTAISTRLGPLHYLSIRRYLGIMFAALVLLLAMIGMIR